MVPITHPLFALLVILRGLLVTLGMGSLEINETLDSLASQTKEVILETILVMKNTLAASSIATPTPFLADNTPSPSLPGVVIREGEAPRSNPDPPPSGKGKGHLISKKKRPRVPDLSGPGNTSTHNAQDLPPPISTSTPILTPGITTPPGVFATQTPLPPPTQSPPPPPPPPPPPGIGDCNARSTWTTTIGDAGITVTIEHGRVHADQAGETFYRLLRQLVSVYLPDLHKTWK